MAHCQKCGRTTDVGQGSRYQIAIVRSAGSPHLVGTWISYTGIIETRLAETPSLEEVCRHYIDAATYDELRSLGLAREIK